MPDKYPQHDAGPIDWTASMWDDDDTNSQDEAQPDVGDAVFFTWNSSDAITLDDYSAYSLGSFDMYGYVGTLAMGYNSIFSEGDVSLDGTITADGATIETFGNLTSYWSAVIDSNITLVMYATTGAVTLYSDGATWPDLYIDDLGGDATFTLTYDLTCASFVLNDGAFYTDGYYLDVASFEAWGGEIDFSSSTVTSAGVFELHYVAATANGASFTADTVELADGASLTVDYMLTIVGQLSVDGTLALGTAAVEVSGDCTLDDTLTASPGATFACGASLALGSGMAFSTDVAWTFNAATGSNTLTSHAVTMGPVTIDDLGGDATLSLGDALTCAAFVLTDGVFDTADYAWTPDSISGAGGELAFGGSAVVVSGDITLDDITATVGAGASINATNLDIGTGGSMTASGDFATDADVTVDGGTLDLGNATWTQTNGNTFTHSSGTVTCTADYSATIDAAGNTLSDITASNWITVENGVNGGGNTKLDFGEPVPPALAEAPFYWTGMTFPSQDGHPVLIVEQAFRDHCCCLCDYWGWYGLWNSGNPCGGLVESYRIKDYIDGDLAACDVCNNYGNPIWDGTFHAIATECYWVAEHQMNSSIDGKKLMAATLALYGNHTWQVSISCYKGTPFGENIWTGRRIGLLPGGEYTRISGCAAEPATIEIEEVP